VGICGKINAIWWNIKINLQKLVDICGYELPTNVQNFMQKDLTDVKIYQKVSGGVYFLGTPCIWECFSNTMFTVNNSNITLLMIQVYHNGDTCRERFRPLEQHESDPGQAARHLRQSKLHTKHLVSTFSHREPVEDNHNRHSSSKLHSKRHKKERSTY